MKLKKLAFGGIKAMTVAALATGGAFATFGAAGCAENNAGMCKTGDKCCCGKKADGEKCCCGTKKADGEKACGGEKK